LGFHLGFDNELVARFPDGALRRQLLKGVPDRPSIRAVDACLELEFHLGRTFIPASSGIVASRLTVFVLLSGFVRSRPIALAIPPQSVEGEGHSGWRLGRGE